MSTTLILESVGVINEIAGLSCRVRTRIRCADGNSLYLEMHGVTQGQHLVQEMQNTRYPVVGCIWHAFVEGTTTKNVKAKPFYFDYTVDGLISVANKLTSREFNAVEFTSKRVHDTTKVFC